MADAKSTKTSDRKLSGAAARAVEKKLAEGAKTMVGGYGESRLHGGHENAKPAADLSAYTCQGLPIPRELWEAFPISLTDQGKAEAAEIRRGLARDLPHVYAGRDRSTPMERIADHDKRIDKFGDDRIDTDGLVLARDVFQPFIEKYTPEGHSGMFMSPKKCAQEGLVRGGVEYKRVLIDDPENPGTLIPVTCGAMFLVSAPLGTVQKADRYHRSLGGDQQKAVIEKVQEQSRQVMRESGIRDFANKRGIGDTLVGMEVEDQQRGDADMLRAALAHE